MKLEEQVLSEEQMKEVVQMDFTPEFIHEHSSMMWVKYHNPHPTYSKDNPILTRLVPASGEYYGVEDITYIPTFTATDILGIIPEYVKWVDENDESNWAIYNQIIKRNKNQYEISYILEEANDTIVSASDVNLLTVLFNILKELKENKLF